jgi:hypothetical protein
MAMQTISAVDLRRWEREPAAIAVTLVLNAEKLKSDTFAATIDVCLSGVCVRTTLALLPRQGVAIVIEGQFSQTIPARVVWVRKDESGNSTIAGLKFLP